MTKIIIILVIVMSLVLFVAQNPSLVTVRFLLWQSHATSLALLVMLAAAAGVLLGLLGIWPAYRRRGRDLAQARRELTEIRERLS